MVDGSACAAHAMETTEDETFDPRVTGESEPSSERRPSGVGRSHGRIFLGMGVYSSDVSTGQSESRSSCSTQIASARMSPTRLSLSMVASQQSPPPFHLASAIVEGEAVDQQLGTRTLDRCRYRPCVPFAARSAVKRGPAGVLDKPNDVIHGLFSRRAYGTRAFCMPRLAQYQAVSARHEMSNTDRS